MRLHGLEEEGERWCLGQRRCPVAQLLKGRRCEVFPGAREDNYELRYTHSVCFCPPRYNRINSGVLCNLLDGTFLKLPLLVHAVVLLSLCRLRSLILITLPPGGRMVQVPRITASILAGP